MCFVFDADDEVGLICEEDYTDVILDVLHKYPNITKCNAAKHNYSTKLSNSALDSRYITLSESYIFC